MALHQGVMLCSVCLLGVDVYAVPHGRVHADTKMRYGRQSYGKRKRIDTSAHRG